MTELPPSGPGPTLPPFPTSESLLTRAPLRLTLWIVLGIWFLGSWLSEPYLVGRGQDWAYFIHHTTVATRSWSEYGQVPMWNPWFCGGIPALANIQTDALAPDLLLTLAFDQPIATALRLLLFIVIGLEGAWRYARLHRVLGLGALIAAAVFMFSGRFMLVMWDGHLPFFGFALAPWVFYGLERAAERWRFGLIAALALTWIFFLGGAVATPIIAMMAGLLVLRDTLERVIAPTAERPRRSWWRPAAALAFVGVLTLILALPRLVPVAHTLIEYPRTWHEPESLSLPHIAGMLFLPPRSFSYFDLGTSYVGLGIGVAFLLALPLRERALIKAAIAALLAFDLAMGEAGPLQLWKLMHALPVVENVRAAFRFTFLVALFVGIGGGRLVWWLEQRIAARGPILWQRLRDRGRRISRPLAIGVSAALALGAALLIGGHGPLATRSKLGEIPRHEIGPAAPGDFHQALGTRWIAQVWPRVNLGSLACFEEQPFPQSAALRGDRAHEEWIAQGKGTLRRLGWSPNEIDLAVASDAGVLVAVNQNAARGWSVSVGEIVEHRGLLSARVPAGEHVVTFTYTEPGIVPLIAVSLATLLAIAAWVVWKRAWRVAPDDRRVAPPEHDQPPDRA